MKRRVVVLAASLAAIAILLPAASAQAVSRSFWGVLPTGATTSQDYTIMGQARVGVARTALYEQRIGPNGGAFDFSASDQVIGNLASRGIQTLPTLLRSQANYDPPISGSALQDWQQFVHAVVTRYKPGGTYWSGPYQAQFGGAASIKPITDWQVWNEPNLRKYFNTSTPVKDYATLLKITHDTALAADPNAKIVLAGMPALFSKFVTFPGWKFLNQLYGVPGAKRNFDIAATHPYAENLDQLRLAMTKIQRTMRRHADKRTPLWITELGYGSDRFNHHLNFGLTGQAKMLRKTFNLILERRKRWKVLGIVWYEWRDPPQRDPDCSFCSSAGLLRSDFSAKPSLVAFKHFTGAGP